MTQTSWSRFFSLTTATAAVCVVSGCAVSPQGSQAGPASYPGQQASTIFNNPNVCSNNGRNIGVMAGAVGGALIGHLIEGNALATVLGGAAGAAAGGLVGHGLDARRCNVYHIALENRIRIASANITPSSLGMSSSGQPARLGLDVQVPDSSTAFEPGSAVLTPRARHYFSEIATQYQPVPRDAPPGTGPAKEKILIVGHTSTAEAASGRQAAALSAQRARAVSQVFADTGVPADNIYYQGAGDALPVAPVATPQGAADNGRIQIVSVPSTPYLKRYLSQRTENPALFSAPKPNVPEHAPEHVAATPAEAPASGYGFGGRPTRQGDTIDLGTVPSHSMFAGIFSAQAAQPVRLDACILSTPHPTTPVTNLASGEPLHIADYVPGLYGAPWTGQAGHSLIALLHVYAPRDNALPVSKPDVRIYKNYFAGNKAHAAFTQGSTASVYRGTSAVLYRVFINGPVQCLDMVVPRGLPVATGHIYYKRGGTMFETTTQFRLAH